MGKIAYLHNHTIYSIKDSIVSPAKYGEKIKKVNDDENGDEIVGMAITDHGVSYGMVKFYNEVSPYTNAIIGCEIYHTEKRMEGNKDSFHMVLLAKDNIGLKNLYAIVSDGGTHKIKRKTAKAKTEGKPQTEDAVLQRHGKGIIALSGCIGGIIPKLILNGNYEKAKEKAIYYKSIFDDFYLEVQPHTIPEQLVVNNDLIQISKETGIELVMTTDTHYLEKEQKIYHDIIKKIDGFPNGGNTENYLKTYDELESYCIEYDIPLSAISNTVKIAEMCKTTPKPKNSNGLYPKFPCPIGYTEETYLRKLAFDNFNKKFINMKQKDYEKRIKRLNYELEIICSKGFSGYFLILWDWFLHCRESNIPLGPGRGSGAGSLVAYVLNITKVDPIKYDLLFERFLNPLRSEPPDVDSDVSKRDRPKAIAYLKDRYGIDYVSQIITFTEYKFKNLIKGVMSALAPDKFEEVNEITKYAPSMIGEKSLSYKGLLDAYKNPEDYELSEAEFDNIVSTVEKLQALIEEYPEVGMALENLGGALASSGIHAGGVIISSEPLKDHLPIEHGSNTAVLPIIQVDMSDVDFFNLLKIDVLGLKTLDQLKDTMDLIGLGWEWYDSEDVSDKKIYKMLREGDTTNVFQMSSAGAIKLLKEFETDCFDTLVAVNAGNRPGPLAKNKETGLSMTDIFAKRKRTGEIPKVDDRLDWITKDTLQCVWYQEHLLMYGQIMSGYNLGGADSRIRKVLGKKKLSMIPEIRNEFVYGKKSIYEGFGKDKHVVGISEEDSEWCIGAIKNGFDEKIALEIFSIMEEFAKYSFNKSHSVAYALLGYKCAYLSYYYPIEWAIGCLKNLDDKKKIAITLEQCRRREIKIVSPNINRSTTGFIKGDDNEIIYGLLAIISVGAIATNYIVKVRNKIGGFTSFKHFYTEVHNKENINEFSEKVTSAGKLTCPVDKRCEESLIYAGAFDCFNENRYEVYNEYIKLKKIKNAEPYNIEDYTDIVKYNLELKYMGSFVSSSPVEDLPYVDLSKCKNNSKVTTSGIVTESVIKKTKNNTSFLSATLVDKNGTTFKANLFSKAYNKFKHIFLANSVVTFEGKYNSLYNNISVSNAEQMFDLNDGDRKNIDDDIVRIDLDMDSSSYFTV